MGVENRDDRQAAGARGEARRNCLAACAMTDAEDYTGVAEGMEPLSLVEFVNSYFNGLFSAVMNNGGIVIDVKGDGILALWTSDTPDRAMRARVCQGCLQMLEAVDSFNGALPARRLPTRIGVDFGPIALANVGALARYEYRAVGDTVNICSRLEQLNKPLGTRLLVSHHLAQGIDEFLFRDLGFFMLRGKRSHIRVLELLAERATATVEQLDLCKGFAGALRAYEAGDVDRALYGFAGVLRRFPSDGPARYFHRRCVELKDKSAVRMPATPDEPLVLALR